MTKRILQFIAVALAGYIVYELVTRFVAERHAMRHRAHRQRQAARPIGQVGGAAMTGGGMGQAQSTLDRDGSSLSERVGRGVVPRQQPG